MLHMALVDNTFQVHLQCKSKIYIGKLHKFNPMEKDYFLPGADQTIQLHLKYLFEP